ncbi:nuclear transport factor 2 family protein [Leptospira brenneri]|nr:nuclear transport factor 2 family protein [Leptospira brenneri]
MIFFYDSFRSTEDAPATKRRPISLHINSGFQKIPIGKEFHMNLPANKKIVTDFFNHLNERNMKEAFALLDDDLHWWILGNIPVSGDYDLKKISFGFKMIFRAFENFQFTLKEMTAEEDRVSVVAESLGIRKSTGKQYNNHYHFLFTLQEGKIRKVKEFFDTVHALWVESPEELETEVNL